MRGKLTPDTLARVMRGLAISRKEGVLHLSNGSVSKRICFKDGVIISTGTDDEEERLGEVLIRAGKLKGTDLDRALSVMKETGQSLGRTVVEMGFTTEVDIAVHALERTKSIICSVFAWPQGQFHFEERDTSIREGKALALSPTEMILDGIRSIEDPALVRESLGDLKAVLGQPKNPLVPHGHRKYDGDRAASEHEHAQIHDPTFEEGRERLGAPNQEARRQVEGRRRAKSLESPSVPARRTKGRR